MAERKLFGLATETTPSNSGLNIAYGSQTDPAKNMTLANLKNWIAGSNLVKSITIEIGAWNMGDTESVSKTIPILISPSVPLAINKVRGISSVMIRSDDISGYYETNEFMSDASGTGLSSGNTVRVLKGGGVTNAEVLLTIRTGSFYRTNQYYNDPSINRGWITVLYVE
jgi:hypothetical protein